MDSLTPVIITTIQHSGKHEMQFLLSSSKDFRAVSCFPLLLCLWSDGGGLMLANSISPSSLVSFPVSLSFSLSEGEDAYPDVRYIAQLEQTLTHGGSSGDYVVDKHYVFPPDSFC